MNKNEKYWRDRLIKEMDEIYKLSTKDIQDKISKLYITTQKELLKELSALRAYNKANNITAISREIMLEETLNNINKSIVLLANNMDNLLTTNLCNSYIQTYETVNDNLKALGIDATAIVPANVEDIIKQPWIGSSYSERIWFNRDKLIYEAKDTISRNLLRGSSYHNMSKELAKKMSSSYSAARRLCETECQASINKANIDNYKNNDIEKCEISSVLDQKLCNDCADRDGKVIEVSKAVLGVNTPPYHPSCRCCLVPCIYIDGELID